MPTRIALLGSTGSIGRQTVDVIRQHPDAFEVVAIAAGHNTALLREQVREQQPQLVVSAERFDGLGTTEWLPTPEGLVAAATHPDVDLVVFATAGHDAIPATIEAIRHQKGIAIANKEAIVCAGDIIMPLAREHGVTIRPIDSEHSAIWQSLASSSTESIQRIMLTASGGPFRTTPAAELARVTHQQALKHPNWSMGAKITVDSATLVNKGLELIEARHLFNTPLDRIEVVVHPEQIIHSLVEFIDGNSIAQMSFPDMRLPIQYALTWPGRLSADARPLDLCSIGSMTFEPPDLERFPALRLAREASEAGQSFPTVYSAVDEVAVEAFANGRLTFLGIARLLETVMGRHNGHAIQELDDVLEADAWARNESEGLISQIA